MALPSKMQAFFSKSENPAADLAKQNQHKTMDGIRQIGDNIYLLDYQNDYYLDDLLSKGMKSVAELVSFATQKFTAGGKFTVNRKNMFGCTSFDAKTPEGEHILARNFDFKEAPCFVVWTHPENAYSSISVADCNFMLFGSKNNRPSESNKFQALLAPYACVDGINEKGLSIAVLQIKTAATNQKQPGISNPNYVIGLDSFPEAYKLVSENRKPLVDITTTTMIRAVLDKCATVEEAIALLSGFRMHDSLYCCYHYQLCDAYGKSVVLEYVGNQLHVIDNNSELFCDDGISSQYVSNYYVTCNHGDEKAEEHGEDRTKHVVDMLKEKDCVLTEMEAMDLLNRVKLNYQHPKYPWRVVALWSSVYNSDAKTLKIAVNMDYTKIYTFKVDEPYTIVKTESSDAKYDFHWDYL